MIWLHLVVSLTGADSQTKGARVVESGSGFDNPCFEANPNSGTSHSCPFFFFVLTKKHDFKQIIFIFYFVLFFCCCFFYKTTAVVLYLYFHFFLRKYIVASLFRIAINICSSVSPIFHCLVLPSINLSAVGKIFCSQFEGVSSQN